MKKTNRTMLTDAFRILRTRSLIARQNFMCCSGCASAELASQCAKDETKVGAVFYHRQEGERLRDGAELVHVSYGHVLGGGENDAKIGAVVAATMVKVGLEARWDGNPERCVEVLLPGGIDAEVTLS